MGLTNMVRVRYGALETDETLCSLARRGISLMLLEADLAGTADEAHALRCRYAPCLAGRPSVDEGVAALEFECNVRVLTPVTAGLLQQGLELLLSRCLADSMTERDGRWNLSWLRQIPIDSHPRSGEGCMSLFSASMSSPSDVARVHAEEAARSLREDDGMPAVLLDRSWRVLGEPYRCASFVAFESVAIAHGYSLRSLIVPEAGGYLHLLFLARNPMIPNPNMTATVSGEGVV
jgi:hypothetical protein